MERAIWNNKEYYAFDIMEDFALETEVRKVSSKELYCPDPCCKKPMLRYCHGDMKDAYFAHLENEECDYGNFDKGTTWSVKKIRRILYEHFKALGYEVQLEQKVLPRHYTHILLTADGKKTAIEIGTQTSIANYIFSVEKQYAKRGITVKWVVISKNDEHRTEADVSYLKRYCFNTSTNNEVLIVDEEGQRFKLSSEEYEKLLIRLVLRNKLIIRIIRATSIGTLNLRELFYMLSDSTYIRRKSNVKSILSILKDSKEYNFDEILSKVVF